MEARHDAFISYNHHDDHNLAKALQEGMEKLAKPLLALRAIEVFRDQTSLACQSRPVDGDRRPIGRHEVAGAAGLSEMGSLLLVQPRGAVVDRESLD
jgi:hypothetical protein